VPVWFGFFFLHTLATPHGLQCGTESFKKRFRKTTIHPGGSRIPKKGIFCAPAHLGLSLCRKWSGVPILEAMTMGVSAAAAKV
jgi:hypothetical protein